MSISTHILDTSRGTPATGVSVILRRRDDTGWIELGENVTNGDGRVPSLLPPNESLRAGQYELRFAVAAYYARSGDVAFFPHITIAFEVRDASTHHHVPLLLSPYGYTTYKGT